VFGSERRRQTGPERAVALRSGLTPAQRNALVVMEGFQWKLAFVRRPLFRDPMPVLVDRSGDRCVVIEADGSINERPALRLRS
jgi:hypothetical protein